MPEANHIAKSGTGLDGLLQDLRFGIRTLSRNPAFAAVAALTLALGIGANTAIFGIVSAVLLRPLPYVHPDELIATSVYYPKGALAMMQARSRSMDLAGYTDSKEFNLTGRGTPVRLTGNEVSADFFSLLGCKAALGRTFHKDENEPGADQLVILSHALWQQRFGSDPAIVGRSITLEGLNRQVVGVMPASFDFPSPKTQLWIPLRMDRSAVGDYWGSSYMALIGRLRDGATLPQARGEFASMSPAVLAAFPWRMPNDAFAHGTVITLSENLVGDSKPKLLILLGAVFFLLMIACANVANLLLARSIARRKEVAARVALGASRWRIVRQLLTESMLLSAAGGLLGLLIASYGIRILKFTLLAGMPRIEGVDLDATVLLFTAFLTMLTSFLFGLIPARDSSNLNLMTTLKSGGERGGTATHDATRATLVVGEIAISVVLVIAAGLCVRSLWKLSNVNPGFTTGHIVMARITPNQTFCDLPTRCFNFYGDLLSRARTLPGVTDVAAANDLPLSGGDGGEMLPVAIEAHQTRPGAHIPLFSEKIVTPNYFRLMHIPLLRGRSFTEADAAPGAQPTVLVSNTTAAKYWPGKNPVGEHIRAPWQNEWSTVIGVVGDVRDYSMSKQMGDWVDGAIYTEFGPHAIRSSGAQIPPAGMILVLQTAGDRLDFAATLQTLVSQINPDVAVSDVRTLESRVSNAVAEPRATASLFSLFAALALLLGGIGVYGVMSYSVAQRTREVGIRVALGSARGEVLYLVLKEAAGLALLGVAIGLAGAFLLTRLIASLLYGVDAVDPITFIGVSILSLLVGLAACAIPAWRATQVDPVVALRYE
jgi:putative ABC transport system permease protein